MIDLLPQESVQHLQNSLSEKRYQHSLGVMQTAFQLAESWIHHPVDRTSLAWASLFHDCGKEIHKEERKRLSTQNSFPFGRELLEIGKLNHAPLGAMLLKKHHGIVDREILMAVAYHPTGHPDLTPLGWMVYIADFLEPNRTYMENRAENLAKACENPLLGLKIVIHLKEQAVLKKNKPIHPIALQFSNYIHSIDTL